MQSIWWNIEQIIFLLFWSMTVYTPFLDIRAQLTFFLDEKFFLHFIWKYFAENESIDWDFSITLEKWSDWFHRYLLLQVAKYRKGLHKIPA